MSVSPTKSAPRAAQRVARDSESPNSIFDHYLQHLETARAWPMRVKEEGVEVSTGVASGLRLYRTRVVLPVSPNEALAAFGGELLEHLPQWSREFHSGLLEAEVVGSGGETGWRYVTRYATPAPLADRLYRYNVWNVGGATPALLYQSTDADEAASGVVTARLEGTLYLFHAHEHGCVVEHLLSTDLGGLIPRWVQTWLLPSSLVHAQREDGRAQRRHFGGVARRVEK